MKGTIWCLHGAVGMAADWKGFEVPGWGVRRVDLWRFLDCCPMSMEAFGRALNEEMVQAGAGKQVLLGYSMGGRLAVEALVELIEPRQKRWDAAVVVSAHPGLVTEGERVQRREQDAEWAARALNGDWDGFLKAWEGQSVLQGRSGREPLAMEDRRGLEARRRSVARSFVDWSLGTQANRREEIRRVACPLLWVAGERDGKFRRLGEEVISTGNGRSELWVAPEAGHRVPWEVPEAFTAKVGEFLERQIS